MTLVTIVTIGLNDLAGYQRTLPNLRKQTYHEVEHIIVDGGSTDGGAEWVSHNTAFANTVVISEPDGGIYPAMNKGLRLARGNVVVFLNAGDCLGDPNVLQVAAQSHRDLGWKWAFGPSQMVDEHNSPVRRRSRMRYSWWRETFWHYDISHQAIFMDTAVIRQYGGFDERFSLAADYHLITRAGKEHPPTLWPHTIAVTLAGGASDRHMKLAHRQLHEARVDIMDLTPFISILDSLWTAFLLGKARLRRAARTLKPMKKGS